MTSNIDGCDFCGSSLDAVYEPADSGSDVSVCVCPHCSLVQSVFRDTSPREKGKSLSSGAQWGNIRHGKRLRLQQLAERLDAEVAILNPKKVLDVGSTRGDFVRWLRTKQADCEIVAIEPDSSLIETYLQIPDTLITDRFENIKLPRLHFDFIHCCHTLEHAKSAAEMIFGMNQSLKMGGVLFVEVPNLAAIFMPNTVEEFFIDKHTFHFSQRTLHDYFAASGFEVSPNTSESDVLHITLFAKKVMDLAKPAKSSANPELARANRKIIGEYAAHLKQSRLDLKLAVEKLHALCDRQKVAVWGAGRLFDAMVRFGGLVPEKIALLVDQFLHGLIPEAHGLQIQRPEALKSSSPQVLVVLARNSSTEITTAARKFGVKNIVQFNDLMPR